MDRNVRWLTVGVAVRLLGNALYMPFLALFLYSVLGVSYLDIGVIILGVGIVQLPFGLAGGLLTDRWGRWRIIVIGLAAEAIATFGLAGAFDVRSLAGAILAATVGGAVATAAGPASQAYIADLTHGPDRTRGFTWYRIGFNAGYSAGVTLGGVLISLIGFAGSVGVAASLIVVAVLLLAVRLEPSPFDRELEQRRRRAAAVAPGGTAASPGPTLRQSLAVLAHDRVALEVSVAFGLAALVAGQWGVTFPLYVHNILGIPYAILGIGLALNGLVVVVGQAPTTERAIGHRHTTIAILGLGLYVVAFLGLGAVARGSIAPIAGFFVAVVVLTVGENLGAIPFSTLPSNMAPPGEVGSYNGAFAAIGSVGFLLAVFVGGVVLTVTSDPLLIWIYLVAPAVPAVLLLRDAARRMRPEVDRA
jgi:MFS family permease